MRERVQVRFENRLVVELSHRLRLTLGTSRENLRDLLLFFAAEFLLQIFGTEMLPPELFRGSEIGWTRRVFAIIAVVFVSTEIEMLGAEQLSNVSRALIEPFEVTRKDHARRAAVTIATCRLRERRLEAREFIDVALQEDHVLPVERVEVTVEKFASQFVIERMMRKLRFLQNLAR